jgi:hypothetical protein
MFFVSEKYKDRLGDVLPYLMREVGLDNVVTFDEHGVIVGEVPCWASNSLSDGSRDLSPYVAKVEIAGNPCGRNDLHMRNLYWRVVSETMTRVFGAGPRRTARLVNEIKSKLFHNDMVYHDEAFSVACELLRISEHTDSMTKKQLATYMKRHKKYRKLVGKLYKEHA